MISQKLIFVAIGVSLIGVLATGNQVPTDSGIYGTATIGPTCPTFREGPNPCADRPYQVTMAVYLVRPDSAIPMIYPTPPGSVPTVRKVTTFTTDSQGNFRVNLRPGTYVLRRDGPATLPSLRDVLATVTKGEFSEVKLNFDSGIR